MQIALVTDVGDDDGETIQALLDVSQSISRAWLRAHPDAPSIYVSGVVYRREPRALTRRGAEDFATAPVCLRRGWGDCDDLAPWRAAEIEVREGVPARAVLTPTRRGYHVVVHRADGTVEDPSELLGMRGA